MKQRAPDPAKDRARRLPKLLLGLGVAAGLLLLIEVIMRAALGPPPPPVVVYAGLQPHEQDFIEQDGMVSAAFQQIDPQPPFPAQTDAPRAAVLGGSSVHETSAGVTAEGQFPAKLAELTGIDVLNLGNPALDSHDLVRITADLRAFSMDAIVVYTGHNDMGNAWFHSRYGDLSAGLAARTQAGLEQLQLYSQLSRLLSPIAHSEATGANTHRSPPLNATQRWAAVRYLESNLRRIVWLAAQADIPVLLVTPVSTLLRPPVSQHCSDGPCAMKIWSQGMRKQDVSMLREARDRDEAPLRAPGIVTEAVRRVAAETSAVLVDAEAGLPRENRLDTPADHLFHDHIHFTQAGHDAMAAVIAPSLRAVLSEQRLP